MKERFCTVCHSVGRPRTETRGRFLIELALWLFFLVPGLIYSIWRLTTRRPVCGTCGSPAIVPVHSPAARAALSRNERT